MAKNAIVADAQYSVLSTFLPGRSRVPSVVAGGSPGRPPREAPCCRCVRREGRRGPLQVGSPGPSDTFAPRMAGDWRVLSAASVIAIDAQGSLRGQLCAPS